MATETYHGMHAQGKPKGGDWQDLLYRKIRVMKKKHLPALTQMYRKIATGHSDLQQPELDKLNISKILLERVITFLKDSKNRKEQKTFSLDDVEKFVSYEKHMEGFISSNIPLEPVSWSFPCNWLETEDERLILASEVSRVQPNRSNLKLEQLEDEIEHKSEKNFEAEGKVQQLQNQTSRVEKTESIVENLLTKHNMLSFLQPGQGLRQVLMEHSRQYRWMVGYTMQAMLKEGKMNDGDWPDVLYEKIQVLKLRYLPALEEMYQTIPKQQDQKMKIPKKKTSSSYLQQARIMIDGLGGVEKTEELDEVEKSKILLEDIIEFLKVPGSNRLTRDDVKAFVSFDILMMGFINSNRSLEPGSWFLPLDLLIHSRVHRITSVKENNGMQLGEEAKVKVLEDKVKGLEDEVKGLQAELKEKDKQLEQLRSIKGPKGSGSKRLRISD